MIVVEASVLGVAQGEDSAAVDGFASGCSGGSCPASSPGPDLHWTCFTAAEADLTGARAASR